MRFPLKSTKWLLNFVLDFNIDFIVALDCQTWPMLCLIESNFQVIQNFYRKGPIVLRTVFVKILKCLSLSLSADLCIHSYWLSWLRQASQGKMIQSSALMPYPCSHFYFDIKFGDRLYSKEKRRALPVLF